MAMSIVRRVTTKVLLGRLSMTSSERHCCSSYSVGNIKADLDQSTGIAVVKWNHKPVNAIGLQFLQNNLEIFRSLESNSSCRGIVITSEIRNLFSAGLDLKEVLECDRQHLVNVRLTLLDLIRAYRLSSLPLVTAINGHAPAGGCMIALASDYRIMTPGIGTIGLNETLFGIPLLKWLALTYVKLLGHRKAELSILHGIMFDAKEALAVGLIDDLAVSDDELLRKAKDQAMKLASIPSEFRRVTKVQLEQSLLDALQSERSHVEATVDQIMSVRHLVQRHMDNVRNRKKDRP